MILECSQCQTRYLVPDSAIGRDGRTVRCASCRHSWFQEPADTEEGADAAQPPVIAPPPRAPAPEPVHTEHAVTDRQQDYDAFAHRPPFRPRRNPAKRWTIAAIAAGFVLFLSAGAILYTGAPGLAVQFGLPIGTAETPLRLVDNPIERRNLENGSEMFAVSGKVVNPTDTRQRVPDIRAELRDAQGRLVYSWTIRPETMSLPPKGSIDFNSAKLDVPVNSKKLVLSFSGETAS